MVMGSRVRVGRRTLPKDVLWNVVRETSDRNSKGSVLVDVRCICGTPNKITWSALTSGKTRMCRECSRKARSIADTGKVYKEFAPYNRLYSTYRSMAGKRQLEFSISKEYFFSLLVQNCYYCGDSPAPRPNAKQRTLPYNGVDRINNLLGYTETNCVPCCKVCNRVKMDHSLEFIKGHMHKMLKHLNEKDAK